VKSTRHIVGHALRALSDDRANRVTLLRDFARLTAGRLTGDEHRSGTVQLLGATVSFQDHALLADMFEEIFLQDEYAIAEAGPVAMILDCGSNIGISILYFAQRYPDATIVGFEADPVKARLLAKNVEQNGLSGRVTVVPKAVGGTAGTAEFHYDASDPGSLTSSLLRAHRDSRTVEVTALSDYVGDGTDILKLDIEGSELDVLEELADTGAIDQVRQILVEVHHNVTEDRLLLSGVTGLLQRAGFRLELRAPLEPPYRHGRLQDILVYAYRD
jgi:FkbM family methyltransferase